MFHLAKRPWMHARVKLNFQANINGGRGEGSLMYAAVVETFYCFFFSFFSFSYGAICRPSQKIYRCHTATIDSPYQLDLKD